MVSNAEIAQYVEASLEVFLGICYAVWGMYIGGIIPTLMGKASDQRRAIQRHFLYALSGGAIAMGFFMFLTVEGAVDCSAGCGRPDGVNAEYGRQIGYLIGSTLTVIALGLYGYFTFAATSVSAFCMIMTFASTLLGTFYGFSTNLTWVIFAFWAFFIVVGGYNTFVSFGTQPTAFYTNYGAATLLYLFVILDGLWLILGVQVTNSFGITTEAGLYAATGNAMLLFVGVLLALTYTTTHTLYPRVVKLYPYRQGNKPRFSR